ncbi:MAG: thiamine phosphate synthase [Rikenellaceae bacterium]
MVDKKSRELILITPEIIYDDEIIVLQHVVSKGGIVHIRKPHADKEMVTEFCETLSALRENLSIHYHHDIATKQRFARSHISVDQISNCSSFEGKLSCSCHSVEEANELEQSRIDYYFISPIFDSISKHGYKSKFSPEQIANIATSKPKSVALGGVSIDNISSLSSFNGIALLGAVWCIEDGKLNVEKSIEQYDQINNKFRNC